MAECGIRIRVSFYNTTPGVYIIICRQDDRHAVPGKAEVLLFLRQFSREGMSVPLPVIVWFIWDRI